MGTRNSVNYFCGGLKDADYRKFVDCYRLSEILFGKQIPNNYDILDLIRRLVVFVIAIL